MSDNLNKVWNTLRSSGYDVVDYDEFAKDMQDDGNLSQVRETLIREGYEVADFDNFKSDMFGSPAIEQEPDNNPAIEQPAIPEVGKPIADDNKALSRMRKAQEGHTVIDEGVEKLKGTIPALKQGTINLVQGVRNVAGEAVNELYGTSADAKEQLAEIERRKAEGLPMDFSDGESVFDAYKQALEKPGITEEEKADILKQYRRTAVNAAMPMMFKMVGVRAPGTAKNTIEQEVKHRNKLNEDLQRRLDANGGDIDKVVAELEEKAGSETWGERQARQSSEAMAAALPTKGVGGFVGTMLPQMVGPAMTIGLGLATKGAAPGLVNAAGKLTLAGLSASTAGASMAEAKRYGATDEQAWAVGMADAAIETITEKIPLDLRYLKRIGAAGKANVSKRLQEAIATEAGSKEFAKMLSEANKKLGGKFFNAHNAKEFGLDLFTEGSSEFLAEFGETLTPIIYERPEDYPTLTEAISNGIEGFKGGLFMGGVLGGMSMGAAHKINNQRRKEQGFVDAAYVDVGKAGNEDVQIAEIVGRDETGKYIVQMGNETQAVDESQILDNARFTYDEFKRGEIEFAGDMAFDEGYRLQDPGQMTKATKRFEAYRTKVAQQLGMSEEELDEIDAANETQMSGGFYGKQAQEGEGRGEKNLIDFANRQYELYLNYVRARASYNGMISAAQDKIATQTEELNKSVDARTNPDTGTIQTVTLKPTNGQETGEQAHIVRGTLVVNPDGTINKTASGDLYILKGEGQEPALISANEIESADPAIDPEQEKAEGAENIANTIADQTEAAMSGRLDFNIGESFEFEDGTVGTIYGQDGNNLIVGVADEQGNVTQVPVPIKTIQDAADTKALAEANAEIDAMEFEEDHSDYRNNESVVVDLGDGEYRAATISPASYEPGMYEVLFSEATPSGETISLMDKDELDAIVRVRDGKEIKPVQQAQPVQKWEPLQPKKKVATITPQEMAERDKIGAVDGLQFRVGDKDYSLFRILDLYRDDNGDLMARVMHRDDIDELTVPFATLQQAYEDWQAPKDFEGNKLPLDADGNVDEAALFESSPEAWAKWNDAEREDGGVDSEKYLRKHAAKVRATLEKLTDQYENELDFGKRRQLDSQIKEQKKALDNLNRIIENYRRQELDLNEPKTFSQYVASYLKDLYRSGELKISRSDFIRETGFGYKDAQAYNFILRKKGMSINELAETIAADNELGLVPLTETGEPDTQEVRNAIINFFRTNRNLRDIFGTTRDENLTHSIETEKAYNERAEWEQENARRKNAVSGDILSEAARLTRLYGNKVNFITDASEVTNKDALEAIMLGEKVRGWFDTGSGEAYIYLPSMQSVKELRQVVTHEVLVHKGLRELMGEQRYTEFCKKVYNDMMTDGERQYFLQRYNGNMSEEAAGDEYLAHIAQAIDLTPAKEKSFWTKVLDKVKSIFGKSEDVDLTYNNDYVAGLIRASYANMIRDVNIKESYQAMQEFVDKFNARPQEDLPEEFVDVPERIAQAEAEVDTNPTDAQKEAGNYKKGHLSLDGFEISIENPKGSVRSGVDRKGNRWETTMRNTYGYIRGRKTVDGDDIDVFLSDNPTDGYVFVVDQINPETGEFDEHKVMYGFNSEDEAKAAYLSNYEEGWQGLGNITGVSKDDFKKWVESSKRKTKPFAEYAGVKEKDAQEESEQLEDMPDFENVASEVVAENPSIEAEQEEEAGREAVAGTIPTLDGFLNTIKSSMQRGRTDKLLRGRRAKLVEESVASGKRFAYSREQFRGNNIVGYIVKNEDGSIYTSNKTEFDYARYLGGNVDNQDRYDEVKRECRYYDLFKKFGYRTPSQRDLVLINRTEKHKQQGLNLPKEQLEKIADLKEYIQLYNERHPDEKLSDGNFESKQEAVAESTVRFSKVKIENIESMAERQYRETGEFSFSGKSKIDSAADVAFIFRELENKSTENSFVVFVKGGVPTILHVGIGDANSTVIDLTAITAGYKDFEPDRVFFVHNHPDGNVIASFVDMNVCKDIQKMYPGIPVGGIVINTVTGKYGYFDKWSNSKKDMPDSPAETNFKVLSFDKSIFKPEFKQEYSGRMIASPEQVAAYISAHRLGEGSKLAALLLNSGNVITANLVTNTNYLDGNNAINLAEEIADAAIRNSASNIILIGNFDFLEDTLQKFKDRLKSVSGDKLNLLDVIQKGENGDYYSISNAEFSGRRRGVMFSKQNANQEMFVSNAQQAVESINMGKASGEQWIKAIQGKGGLKAGEDKWLGLSQWLSEQTKPVTKDDVLKFIEENRIQIEEVHYGYNDADFDKLNDEFKQKRREIESLYDMSKEEAQEGDLSQVILWQQLHDTPESELWQTIDDVALEELASDYNGGDDFKMAFEVIDGELAISDDDRAAFFLGDANAINDIRLKYTTPDLNNKREIALTVPTIESWKEDDETHFGDADDGRAIAWARFGDTKDAGGNKVLAIDEIQSNRHQEGREKGYSTKEQIDLLNSNNAQAIANNVAAYEAFCERMVEKYGGTRAGFEYVRKMTNAEYAEWERLQSSTEGVEDINLIPPAPFEKNWHELTFKRMLRLAAEEGYDKVAWTSGDMQADRYNIGRVVSQIKNGKWMKYDGDDEVQNLATLYLKNGEKLDIDYTKDGDVIGGEYDGKKLSDIVGEDLAQKLLENEFVDIAGNDLRIRNKGMSGFYDEIIPRFVDKYCKKWGVKTQDIELPVGKGLWHSVEVTPEMKESVMKGQTMFSKVTPEMDAEYLSAVESGDMEKAQKMVDEAARKAGYTTPILYHGTGKFGFTSFDSKRKSGAIFTTSARNVSANYAGDNNYASPRMIAKKYKEPRTIQDTIDNAKSVFGQNYRIATNEERKAVIDDVTTRAKQVANKINSLMTNVTYGEGPLGDDFAWASNIIYDAADALDNGNSRKAVSDFLKTDYERFKESRQNIRDYTGELSKEEKELADYLCGYEVGDLAIEAGLSMMKALSDGDILTVDGNQFLLPDEANEAIARAKDIGAYSLYGNLGENPLEIDANGKVWYELGYNGIDNTDDVAEWAKDNGYTSVVVKNVFDYGDKADDYIFFNPEQIKSADPVTYDDNGDIIPLSERFNEKESDIRFSKLSSSNLRNLSNEISNEQYERFAKEVYRGNEKAREDINRIASGMDWDFEKATRQYLSDLSDVWELKDYQQSIIDKARNAFGEDLSNEEVKYILWSKGDREKGVFGAADDVVMQRSLGVGDYKNNSTMFSKLGIFNKLLNKKNDGQQRINNSGDAERVRGKNDVLLWARTLLRSDEGTGESAGGNVGQSQRNREDERLLEEAAKERGVWYDDIDDYLLQKYDDMIARGEEADVYLDSEEAKAIKSKAITYKSIKDALDAVEIHNLLFPDTELTVLGFGKDMDGQFRILLSQDFLSVIKPATEKEIESFIKSLGLKKKEGTKYTYTNGSVDVSDLHNGNVVIDSKSGRIVCIDCKAAYTEKGKRKGGGDSGIRFSKAQSIYEEKNRVIDKNGEKKSSANLAQRVFEGYWDSMKALQDAQDAVAEETGKPIKDFENAYFAENAMSSVNLEEAKAYERDYVAPITEELEKLYKAGVKHESIIEYLIAKHGLERNRVMQQRAEQKLRTEWQQKIDAIPDDAKDRSQKIAELAEQYNEKIRKTHHDYAGLSALTESKSDYTALARDIVSQFEGKHETKALWGAIRRATQNTLHNTYNAGMMTDEQYAEIVPMYEYYIPLRGWNDGTVRDIYNYLQSSEPLREKVMKAATGRTSIADDPIAEIQKMAYDGIVSANRNRMKQKFLNMVLNHPTDLFTVSEQWYTKNAATGEWDAASPDIQENDSPVRIKQKIDAFEEQMKAAAAEGNAKKQRGKLVLGKHATSFEKREHEAHIFRNGKEYVVYVCGNPRVMQALNGLTNPNSDSNDFEKGLQTVKNFMSQAFTSKNVAFILKNLARDTMFSGFSVFAKENGAYLKQYNANYGKSLIGAAGLIKKANNGTLDESVPIERYFHEFLKGGGETGYTNAVSIDTYKKRMKEFEEKITASGMKKAKSVPKDALIAALDGIEYLNRCAEDVTRFAVYMTSRQMGRTVARSIWDAKNVTVNFNKKGSGEYGAKWCNFAYIFFNACIQSAANITRIVKENPKKGIIGLSGMLAAGCLVPVITLMAQAMLGYGEDDDEMSYWDLPEWTRRNNLVFWIPGTNAYFTFPIAQELRPLYNIGEIAASAMFGKENVEDGIKKGAEGITTLLPIDVTGNGGDLKAQLVNFTPTAFQPVAQIITNRDFFGTPIYKGGEYNKDNPEWTKAYKGTSGWLVDGTKWLNGIRRGNEVDKGLINLNPAIIEHLFESYLGGSGKTFNQFCKTISSLWSDDELMMRNVPVASSFVQTVDERQSGSQTGREYYKLRDEYEKAQNRYSGYTAQLKREGGVRAEEYAERLSEYTKTDEFKRFWKMKRYINYIDNLNSKKKNLPQEQADALELKILELKRKMIEDMKEE